MSPMISFASLAVTIALAVLSVQERETIVAGKLGETTDAYLQNCEAFGFSGTVVVQKKGKLLLRKGYGIARADLDLRNTPETLYDIASASKQVTAAAILLLEANGELSTGDSIAKYLPDVPKQHQEVTIYHLLTHTSGFPRNGSAGGGPDLEAAMRSYFKSKRTGKSGKKFEYYNGGYAMLAGIVEQVTGETFETWVTENLFKPAGLRNTDFIETALVEEDLLARSHDTGKLTTDYIQGWGYRGMGGVLTSVSDLTLWCNALFAGKVIPPKALKKMLKPYRDDYACGWYSSKTSKKRHVISHGGTSPGFQSYIRYFDKDEVLILVLTNREGWHWQTAWGLAAIVLGEDAKASLPPGVVTISNQQLDAFCGTWEADGERLIVERSGVGLKVGGVGRTVLACLATSPPGRSSNKSSQRSSKREQAQLAASEERAMAIVAELREGSCELLSQDMMPHIPKSWPSMVLNNLWPKFIERWGDIRSQQCLGAFKDAKTGRTRVWIRLEMEQASRSIEVAFLNDQLNIFDLKARDYPVEAHFAPVAKGKMVGFDFAETPPRELRLKGKGKSQTLELKTRAGSKLTLQRVD